MSERLPNFIYIGPSKAGSTWLHEVLIRHPQIYMCSGKDLYFFDRYFERGIGWYAGHFRDVRVEQRVVGEVCQEYLSSAEAPKRMRSSLGPELRLMVTLRDPVARAFSGYLYMRKHGVFDGSFRQALDSRPGMFDHSRYATLLSQYLEYFDLSAIHCALFDDLVEDAQSFIDALLAWLDVDQMELDESLLAARLPAAKARSLPLARAAKLGANWARQHNAATLVGMVKRSSVVQQALYVRLGDDKPRLSEDDAMYVREVLRPEIVQVEKMLGLDLRRRWDWPE